MKESHPLPKLPKTKKRGPLEKAEPCSLPADDIIQKAKHLKVTVVAPVYVFRHVMFKVQSIMELGS
jgi:hypothetical protein